MSNGNSPPDRRHRIERLRAILRSEEIASQEDLADRLRAEGHLATQSSISRDLRDVGAAKVGGIYRVAEDLGARPLGDAAANDLAQFVRAVTVAGPHLIVIRTEVGAAQRCGLLIDGLLVPGIAGTIAGDDTVFVACKDATAQQRALNRIESLTEETLR